MKVLAPIRLAAKICLGLAASGCLLAGCNDGVTKPAQVRAPASTPVPVATASKIVTEPMALPFVPRAAVASDKNFEKRPAIDILVAGVQTVYDAGQTELKAGHRDNAQEKFDLAADMILKSGFPADYTPELSTLSDEIGEATQPGDLDAANAGDEDADQEEESDTPATPAPIDEIADLTLPAGDPRLAAKAEKELIAVRHDLPLTVNDSVLQYLSFFTTTHGRMIVEHGLDRAGRYDAMIRRVLKEEGVPQDLIYLAQAESAFQPQAVSKAGARGIWQFMPYRGEEYDLERTYWVDQRSDPEKATRAAAHHMRDLYGMFGDWYLVMAAYNSGPLNVQRAIERTGYADFWELQKRHALPRQTQNYVPIIVALAMVAKDPARYGVQVSPEKPPSTETIALDHSISLQLVADACGADVDDLRLLNPALLRSVTPTEPGFQLVLPLGTARNFQDNVQQVPTDKWTSWRLHPAAEGETLPDVARRYRVTLAALESANHLEPRASVPAGFVLNIPTPPPGARLVHYRVQRGDTLAGIAERFDVTVDELKRWNHISGGHVTRGSRLKIYAGSVSAAAAPARGKSAQATHVSGIENVSTGKSAEKSAPKSESPAPVEHHVKPGETVYSIARAYQISVSAIRQANPFLAERALQAGDILTIQR
jgi:membrane-bound lytic murein transglycosylase D